MNIDLNTKAKNTWCPGCTNFMILTAFKNALSELITEGKIKKDNIVVGAGIGCHGKIADYVGTNSIISLHGRVVPTMTGVKLGNPNLTAIAFSGDGDSYAEGIEHLVHAAKRNSDIKLFVHNNQVFGLTTGQVTPTSNRGYKGKSTPQGSVEEPINPQMVMLASGATFIARVYTGDLPFMTQIMKKAILHKGFAHLEIIQPCISFNDTRDYFKERVYNLEENSPKNDLQWAMQKVQEKKRIPLGIFYEVEKPVFEEQL
ncbi:MAG TPA: thiamine pyrophosphate-dependent enzyme [Candidatus Magasanikbacteria bacterium]|nr:thiamine pyrophosphate-dependent enzyme [Candidatus Magasanikbacteria bacterium]